MEDSGTIYIEFNTVSCSFGSIDSVDDPGLPHFVLLDDPSLEAVLYRAVDQEYPDEVWSSPGNSMGRRLFQWVLWETPSLRNVSDPAQVIENIERAREQMAQAFRTRKYETHYYPEVPDALIAWIKQGFRIVTFGATEEHVTAVVEHAGLASTLKQAIRVESVDEVHRSVSDASPEDRERILAIIHGSVVWWREKGVRAISVDRCWVVKPYLEKGYGFNVRLLTDVDPNRELRREYY